MSHARFYKQLYITVKVYNIRQATQVLLLMLMQLSHYQLSQTLKLALATLIYQKLGSNYFTVY